MICLTAMQVSAVLAIVQIVGVTGRQACKTDSQLALKVFDSSGAVIVGAKIRIDGTEVGKTDTEGTLSASCLSKGTHVITADSVGFQSARVDFKMPGSGSKFESIHLRPMTVKTIVDVIDDAPLSGSRLVNGQTVDGEQLKMMADDPDEFARQLQVLGALSGGSPGQAITTVDGFQGNARLPPKSSIAYVRVNPDLFSAEFEKAPYLGGRVEIYTKPSQTRIHGAFFGNFSTRWMNAKDALSLSKASLGRQRLGLEISSPIRANRSDISVAFEQRKIDQFGVLRAVTLDQNGNPVTDTANIPTSQNLWLGSAKLGWLPNARNNVSVSYTGNVNRLDNVGAGGITLKESAYHSLQSEHVLRISDSQTISPSLLHETRLALTWRNETDTPNSQLPSVQVAGAFIAGGAPIQTATTHERTLEFDDDVLYGYRKHSFKTGVEIFNTSYANDMPQNFNGTFLFGGAMDSGTGTFISALEQYRRALLNLPGGTPTAYSVTVGKPKITIDQLRLALYAQDQWRAGPHLITSLGLRYAIQTAPISIDNAGPRVAISWTPDKKQRLIVHIRSGLFFSVVDVKTALEAERLNGRNQRELLVYAPNYASPLDGSSKPVETLRSLRPGMNQAPSWQSQLGVEYDLPRHWHVQGNAYLLDGWNRIRSRNINSPLDGTPNGPRPLVPGQNIFQFQQSGHLRGSVAFFGLDQHSLKKLQIFAGYIRMSLHTNTDSDSTFPQQSNTDAGENARPSWQPTHHVIAFSTISLPKRISLSTQFDAASGLPNNITTGFDNNGDGVFNDRPIYASSQSGISYPTRFGLLAPYGNGVSIPRNADTLPWNIHLDVNVSRTFAITHPLEGEPQALSLNIRSTNALNHTNVNAVGSVLGSPVFGVPYSADPSRRVEVGVRYSF